MHYGQKTSGATGQYTIGRVLFKSLSAPLVRPELRQEFHVYSGQDADSSNSARSSICRLGANYISLLTE
jgi:hypothetical protein